MAKFSHVVFVSYTSKDQAIADAVCGALEPQGIRCWIAHRDNRAGDNWDEGILDAIDSAKIVVVVLSSHANESPMVKRELVIAAGKNIPIIPLRIEDVELSKGLQFSLSGVHWLNAFTRPIESHLELLAEAVRQLLQPVQRDVDVYSYMALRGPAAYRDFMVRPRRPWAKGPPETLGVGSLRERLLFGSASVKRPMRLTVDGTFFPGAPLASGWSERTRKFGVVIWRDGLQKFLFQGFDLWQPSWDFTWDFDNWNRSKTRPYFIAQLGEDDEANCIPVIIPAAKATALLEHFVANRGGFEARVRGILGHRDHFLQEGTDRQRFGGLLDYCIWIDADDKEHGISPSSRMPELYSGYLWKCVGLRQLTSGNTQTLSKV